MRKITVSSDKDKFGVRLKAEPDNQTLGRRLKGAFKEVSQQIKGSILIWNVLKINVVVFPGGSKGWHLFPTFFIEINLLDLYYVFLHFCHIL